MFLAKFFFVTNNCTFWENSKQVKNSTFKKVLSCNKSMNMNVSLCNQRISLKGFS